jgi:hypothetical protein
MDSMNSFMVIEKINNIVKEYVVWMRTNITAKMVKNAHMEAVEELEMMGVARKPNADLLLRLIFEDHYKNELVQRIHNETGISKYFALDSATLFLDSDLALPLHQVIEEMMNNRPTISIQRKR